MVERIIDTNVLLVANGSHDSVSEDCVMACITGLSEIMSSMTVVIDDDYRIISEYQNKLSANRPKGAGDVFLKWLVQNQANPARVITVTLTEEEEHHFAEFPVPGLEPAFDAPDRKFVAVANAHPSRPVIWQAVDSKWLKWWKQLADADIRVEFLCPEDICRFFRGKFPDEPVPHLP